MTRFLKTLILLTTLIAAPAFAGQPGPHAEYHPAADARSAVASPDTKPNTKPAMAGCPMKDGKMKGGAGAMTGKGSGGKMMMNHQDMHCMSGPTASKVAGTAAPHDHDHSKAAPK